MKTALRFAMVPALVFLGSISRAANSSCIEAYSAPPELEASATNEAHETLRAQIFDLQDQIAELSASETAIAWMLNNNLRPLLRRAEVEGVDLGNRPAVKRAPPKPDLIKTGAMSRVKEPSSAAVEPISKPREKIPPVPVIGIMKPFAQGHLPSPHESVIFSPDGNTLYYYDESGLGTVDVSRKSVTILPHGNLGLSPIGLDHAYHFVVSQNGFAILTTGRSTTYGLRPDETLVVHLKKTMGGETIFDRKRVEYPALSEDGEWIAYYRKNDGRIFKVRDLVHQSTRSEELPLPDGEHPSFKFSPDNRTVSVLMQNHGGSTLTEIDRESRASTTRTLVGQWKFSDERNLIRIDPGQSTEIPNGANGWVQREALDLKYERTETAINIRRISNNLIVQTLSFPDRKNFRFVVSRDGKKIAVFWPNTEESAHPDGMPIEVFSTEGP